MLVEDGYSSVLPAAYSKKFKGNFNLIKTEYAGEYLKNGKSLSKQ